MKNIVVLSGSGISAESGISTFRDSSGLWENYRIEDVATPEAWHKNHEIVLDFYNQRRKKVVEAKPNAAHLALAKLEEFFHVQIVTQNVDDLHERAGSTAVLHLHGEIRKARSTIDAELIYPIDGWELKSGDRCEKGSQLRPHIVWFGEAVPMIMKAERVMEKADLFILIGTSLNVYPAAALIHSIPHDVPRFIIDPKPDFINPTLGFRIIAENATTGMLRLADELVHKK
jgi:NAD-dependent deacetylase